MFTKLTDFTRRFAYHPHAKLWLFFYAVIESVFFPIPPEVLFLPMSLANPRKAVWFATIAALGSAAGGAVGYAIGYYLFQPVAMPILEALCGSITAACPENFIPVLHGLFAKHGIWVIAISAISPIIPYRFTILAAGLAQMPFLPFVVMSIITHWVRYTTLAWLTAHYGRKAYYFAMQRGPWAFALIGVLALAVFLLVNYL